MQLANWFVINWWARRLRPDLHRPYRTPGYPAVPLIFLGASLAMILNALVHEPLLSLFGFGLILAGVPVYLLGCELLEAAPGVSEEELRAKTGVPFKS